MKQRVGYVTAGAQVGSLEALRSVHTALNELGAENTLERTDALRQLSRLGLRHRVVQADYVVRDLEHTLFLVNSTATVRIYLPHPEDALGSLIYVKKLGTGNVEIAGLSGLIDNGASVTLLIQYESRTFYSDRKNYWIV